MFYVPEEQNHVRKEQQPEIFVLLWNCCTLSSSMFHNHWAILLVSVLP